MKVVVIGGGPSGLMASGISAELGNDVTLIESNEKLGKKLYITGKGRCNVTNLVLPDEFLNNVVNNSKFLYSAIYKFSPYDTMEFFENQKINLKIERGNRVFPVSDKASDITKGLENFAIKNNVKIRLNEKIIDVSKNDKFTIKTTYCTYCDVDYIICCTGGKSYSATGSTGDGYIFAKKFGHKIVEPKPALVPIILKDDYIKDIEGLPLKNVKLKIVTENFEKQFFGEMLFTSRGISGPIVLSASSYVNRENVKKLSIDFKPALSEEQLNNRLLRDFEENKNVNIFNVMRGLLPKNLVNIFLAKCNIATTKKVNNIKVEERNIIIKTLKDFELTYKCLENLELGIVTSGGVDVKEVNPKTMESKLCKGLYFAGEVLDVDALTGGFNIQIALATGFVAGHLQ